MTEPRKLKVFLCHSSQDKPIVRELYQRLNAEGWIDPWLDEEKIIPGQDRQIIKEKALLNTDAAIICLSKNTISKEGYMQKEVRIALDILLERPTGSFNIISLKTEECEIPRQLLNWQILEYSPPTRSGHGYGKVLDCLKDYKKELMSK